MRSLADLAALESDDPELVPEILPVDARLAISAPTAVLVRLFERVVAVAPVKEVIPRTSFIQMDAVEADAGAVGYIRLTATDGEQTLSVMSDNTLIRQDGTVLLPGRKILEMLKMAPENTATFLVLGTTATLTSGRARWTLELPVGDALPPRPNVDGIELHSVPRKPFLRALVVARMAVSTSQSRASLQQAQIRAGYLTGSDAARVHRVSLTDFPRDLDTAIPLWMLDELIRALRATDVEFVDFGASDLHLVAHIGQDVLVSQRLLVGYPDLEHVLLNPALSNKEHFTVSTGELAQTIKRVRVNADPDLQLINIDIVPGAKKDGKTPFALVVWARDKIGNTSREVLGVQWSGGTAARTFTVNHKHLTEALAAHGLEVVRIKVGADTKTQRYPLLIVNEEFTGVIQQMTALG